MDGQLCFIPSRSLLRPAFESYKLKEYDHSSIRRIPLPTPIDRAIRPDFKSFHFQELKAKSVWNHLLVGRFPHAPAQLIWIEPSTLQISALNQPDSNEPHVSSLLRLPDRRAEQLGDQSDQGIEFDYPTGLALNHHRLSHPASPQKTAQNLWLILDGGRTLFLADLNPHSPPRVLAQKELGQPSDGFIHGFYTLASVEVKDGHADTFWMVIRAKSIQTVPQSGTVKNAGLSKKRELLYTLYLVEMRIMPSSSTATTGHSSLLPFDLELQPHARLVGPGDLLAVHYDRPGHRWCLRSTSKFTTVSQQACQSARPQDHSMGNFAQQPQSGKEEADPKPAGGSLALGPPYGWSQTLSSLTVLFHIPFSITSKSIKIDFQAGALSFRLPKLDSLPKEAEDYLKKLFEYFGQQFKGPGQDNEGLLALDLWDHVVTEDCTWFVESSGPITRPGQVPITLLTLELEKRTRLRWPQAFKVDAHVSETMDPLELLSITENLAKYTSTADDDEQDPTGQPSKKPKRGLGATGPSAAATRAHPMAQTSSLSAGEIDEEIDLANEVMVTGVVMTWLIQKDLADSQPPPAEAGDRTDSEWLVKVGQAGIPVELIANPLKVVRLPRQPPSPEEASSSSSGGDKEEDEDDRDAGSIMIKADIDGLVFSPPVGRADRTDLRWTHRLSYPALAFVMASKREIWAAFFTNQVSLLFETSATAKDSRSLGNLFVYHHSPGHHTISSQQVIQLSSSSSGLQASEKSSGTPAAHILGICALQKPPNASLSSNPAAPDRLPLSIILLSQHEILLFDL